MNAQVIGATRLEQVFESKIRENFAAITGEMAPKKVEDVVRGLEEHFAKAPTEDLGQCDICLGWSAVVEGIATCPYCDDNPAQAAPAAVVKAEVLSAEESARLDEIPIDAAAMIEAGVDLEGGTPKGRKKVTGATVVDMAERRKVTAAPPVPKPSSAVVHVPIAAGGAIPRTEKELDDALVRYHAAATSGADSLYLMGVELTKMRDHLWQQRAEDGKPKYKSFNQFVADELDISKALAYRMVRVVENFTHEQFRKFGAQVLKVLVAAPKEEHEMLLQQAEKGATTRDLEAEVKRIREDRGIQVIETSTTSENKKAGRSSPSAAATTAAATARKRESAAITVGLKAETATIKLMARTKAGEPERAATKLEDQPYGQLECINGVTLFVAIKVRPTGEIEAKLTAKREKDDGEE